MSKSEKELESIRAELAKLSVKLLIEQREYFNEVFKSNEYTFIPQKLKELEDLYKTYKGMEFIIDQNNND